MLPVGLVLALTGCAESENPSSVDADPATEVASDRPSVDDLAALHPLDLMTDLGPTGWTAAYPEGVGLEVTFENWADAYELTEEGAASEIEAARENGWEAAATQQWREESTDATMRLTIRRYESLAAIESAWWDDNIEQGRVPDGVELIDGLRLGCREQFESGENRFYSDCAATIGDTTVVYLSSTNPDGDASESNAFDGIAEWIEAHS